MNSGILNSDQIWRMNQSFCWFCLFFKSIFWKALFYWFCTWCCNSYFVLARYNEFWYSEFWLDMMDESLFLLILSFFSKVFSEKPYSIDFTLDVAIYTLCNSGQIWWILIFWILARYSEFWYSEFWPYMMDESACQWVGSQPMARRLHIQRARVIFGIPFFLQVTSLDLKG